MTSHLQLLLPGLPSHDGLYAGTLNPNEPVYPFPPTAGKITSSFICAVLVPMSFLFLEIFVDVYVFILQVNFSANTYISLNQNV